MSKRLVGKTYPDKMIPGHGLPRSAESTYFLTNGANRMLLGINLVSSHKVSAVGNYRKYLTE